MKKKILDHLFSITVVALTGLVFYVAVSFLLDTFYFADRRGKPYLGSGSTKLEQALLDDPIASYDKNRHWYLNKDGQIVYPDLEWRPKGMLPYALFMNRAYAAGTLIPVWEATQTLGTFAGDGIAGGCSEVGTIDNGSYYVCEIYVYAVETGSNPAGSAGVSVYISGTTSGGIPVAEAVFNATTLQNYEDVTSTGVTKTLVFENVREITVGAGESTVADNWSVTIKYRRMTGYYN